jgi:hypothetical protein
MLFRHSTAHDFVTFAGVLWASGAQRFLRLRSQPTLRKRHSYRRATIGSTIAARRAGM